MYTVLFLLFLTPGLAFVVGAAVIVSCVWWFWTLQFLLSLLKGRSL